MKHIPLRRCVSCNSRMPQRELVRIVRTPQGTIGIDDSANQNGRAAYLCRQIECWTKALKSNRLSKSLRLDISQKDFADLAKYSIMIEHGTSGEKPTLV